MYTVVIFQYIVNASDIRYDCHFMKVNNLQEYVFVGSVFGHNLHESGDFVDLFLVEREDFLFSPFYRFSEQNNPKKKYNENGE